MSDQLREATTGDRRHQAGTLNVPNRPRVTGRTHSAPLVPTATDGYVPTTLTAIAGQDHETNDTEVNIAVVGCPGVGKSTFIQRSLGLATRPTAVISSRRFSLDSASYVVRMVEYQLDDVTVDGESKIRWPLDGRIDAALTLYDVGEKDSFEQVPVMLNALEKASVPSVLVSCKCDIEPPQRQIDPNNVEQRAKSILRNLDTLQTSSAHHDVHVAEVSTFLQAVVAATSAQRDPSSSARRRTTISSALQAAASRNPYRRHTRANSEMSGIMKKEASHSRHDSTLLSQAPTSANRVPDMSAEEARHSLVNHDGSQISASSESDRNSLSDDDDRLDVDTQSEAPSDERGYSFDNLIDRLLKLPRSKADTRFSAVFLALYRKFAAPGQLLEAIVHRFEALEADNVPFMSRTVSQLRYLSVIEQWIGTYPGDFAHPKTRRRMRTFVAKLSNTRIFSAAAREMSADLDVVAEDDDTNWSCCDKDRERENSVDHTPIWSSRVSILLDDPGFNFGDNLGNLSLNGAPMTSSGTLNADSGALQIIDAARKQAQSLVPTPRNPINKVHWRTLLDTPTDVIACELTRIDWIMFSSMRPRDLVRHVSLSQTQKASCKSLVYVSRMIDHFNHLRDWVANFILLRDKAKHRVLMLEKFMHVARKLREMNNYNSLGAFLAGISSAAVHRLIATRELLPPDAVKDWMKLEILMSPTRSYSSYRLAWENSSGERIPFLPLPIRDLVAAEEGNKTYIGEEVNGRINWRKFEVMGETVVGIQKAQGLPYRASMLGPKNDELRSLILNSNMIRDDEVLYERSLHVESSGGGDRRGLREFFKR